MDEMLLGGLIAMFSALPGLGLGGAMLIGKLQPASLATARDPARARVATGAYLIVVDLMVMLLGIGLISLPKARIQAMVPFATAVVVGVAFLGLIPLFRATRP